jgi:sterol desaturase/sphingolipid hydroxylase (fatty acid hydroxylase superfamily)
MNGSLYFSVKAFMEMYFQTFLNGYYNYARYLWHEITHPAWNNYFYWLLGISLFFFLSELLMPWHKRESKFRKDFWLDAFYMFFNFFLFSLVIYNASSDVVVKFFNDILASVGIQNLVAFEVMSWPLWAHLLLAFVMRDFIQWWVHRLLHRVPSLWEFHKLHHSVEEMGFAAHLRYHWMETIVYRSIEYIPLALIGIGLRDFFIIHIFTLAVGHFNHSNIRLNLGPLKYIFNNPQMHIWHHAADLPEGKQNGVNFGLTLSIWDYLFKTYYIPYEGKGIRLGFKDVEKFPRSFIQQVTYGFRRKKANTPEKVLEESADASFSEISN